MGKLLRRMKFLLTFYNKLEEEGISYTTKSKESRSNKRKKVICTRFKMPNKAIRNINNTSKKCIQRTKSLLFTKSKRKIQKTRDLGKMMIRNGPMNRLNRSRSKMKR